MPYRKDKDAFSERLARIAAENEEPAAHRSVSAPVQSPNSRARPKSDRARHMLTAAVVCIAAIGFSIGFSTLRGQSISSGSASFFGAVNLTTGNPVVDRNASPPARKLTHIGWELTGSALATPHPEAQHLVGQVASGVTPITPLIRPRTLIPFDTNMTCTLRRPQSGEVVRNVRLENGAMATGVKTYTRADVAEALTEHLAGTRNSSKSYRLGHMASGRMNAVDVFVTDTKAPVYLVLQTDRADTIWNVQAAPDVRIAHVAMIGNASGLVAPEPGTSFEALRISDFVDNFEFDTNRTVRPCMIQPVRKPAAHWPSSKQAKAGDKNHRNLVINTTEAFEAFNVWYTATLGVDANTNLTAAKSATHVLSGPIPKTVFAYQPMDGREIHVTRNDYVLWGPNQHNALHDQVYAAAHGAVTPADTPRARSRDAYSAGWNQFNLPLRHEFTRISMVIPAMNILTPDEAVPHPDYLELYGKARASLIFDGLCGILTTDNCRVPLGGVRKKDRSTLDYSAQIRFEPNYVQMKRADFPNPLTNYLTIKAGDFGTFPNTSQGRRDALQRAVSICDEVRAQVQHCSISSLTLTNIDGSAGQILEGEASLTVIVDEKELTKDEVKATFAAVLNR